MPLGCCHEAGLSAHAQARAASVLGWNAAHTAHMVAGMVVARGVLGRRRRTMEQFVDVCSRPCG